jgi:hypothetical protein
MASDLGDGVVEKGNNRPSITRGYDVVHVLDIEMTGLDVGQLDAVFAPHLALAVNGRVHGRICRLDGLGARLDVAVS